MQLKQIIEKDDTRSGKAFDLFIQSLIVVSLISFSIETIPDLSPQTGKILKIIEISTVLLFTFEYLLRIAVSEKKLKFIFSFYGLIDLWAILPQ